MRRQIKGTRVDKGGLAVQALGQLALGDWRASATVTGRPARVDSEQTAALGTPQGTIAAKRVRSVSQLRAKPWLVTSAWETRMPIAASLAADVDAGGVAEFRVGASASKAATPMRASWTLPTHSRRSGARSSRVMG